MLLAILHNQNQPHELILDYLIVLLSLNLMLTNSKKKIAYLHLEYKDLNNKVLLLDNKFVLEIQVKAL